MKIISIAICCIFLISCKPSVDYAEDCRVFSGWRDLSQKIPELRPAVYVRIEQGKILFMKEPVTRAELSRRLREFNTLDPQPFFILTARKSDCSEILNVKRIMEKELQCRQGLCGFGENWER